MSSVTRLGGTDGRGEGREQDLKPWDMIKVNPDEGGSVIAGAIGLVALLAALAEPFMPSVHAKVPSL